MQRGARNGRMLFIMATPPRRKLFVTFIVNIDVPGMNGGVPVLFLMPVVREMGEGGGQTSIEL